MQITTEYLTKVRADVDARRIATLSQLQQITGTLSMLDALIDRSEAQEPVEPALAPKPTTKPVLKKAPAKP